MYEVFIRYRCAGDASRVMIWEPIGYKMIVCNLNIHRYISQILRLMVVSYLRGLGDIMFLQDNTSLRVVRRALAYFKTEGYRLLPCFVQSEYKIQKTANSSAPGFEGDEVRNKRQSTRILSRGTLPDLQTRTLEIH
ncbi:hypothetical protein TNCV_3658331 [Trichonephila clavipes]|nr:hypothetical protein TNCV_3658331 [Trichonephila clavipes]